MARAKGYAWYARTRSSRRWLSWMVWLETAAADRGDTLLPCSYAWYASATASGATPCSADGKDHVRDAHQFLNDQSLPQQMRHVSSSVDLLCEVGLSDGDIAREDYATG